MKPEVTYHFCKDRHYRHVFEIDGRPYGKWVSNARLEMKQWAIDNELDHAAAPDASSIAFHDENDAAMFKMRWMGQ